MTSDLFTRSGAEVLMEEPKTSGDKPKKRFLKSGESIVVRIPSTKDFKEYKSHGGLFLSEKFQIYNCACLAHVNGFDPYDKAVKELYTDLDGLKETKGEKSDEFKVLNKLVYDLRAKKKILLGFFDLETGDEIVLELTHNQGKTIAAQIQEYGESVYEIPFKISKQGTKTETTVTLMPIMNKVTLNGTQAKNFGATAGQIFNQELFSKVLYTKTDEQMIKDLNTIGFDVTRIGYEVPEMDELKTDEEVKEAVNDLPF